MSLETELSADEGTGPPSTKFVKMWKIRSSGDNICHSHLVFKHGHKIYLQDKIYINHSVQVSDEKSFIYIA